MARAWQRRLVRRLGVEDQALSLQQGCWDIRDAVRSVPYLARGYRFGRDIPAAQPPLPLAESTAAGPLVTYVEEHTEGPGIWKWKHYFDVFERHLDRFRDKPVGLLEIGVLGGGTLQMWREYLGPHVHVYGIDVDPACKSLEREGVEIAIGDQGDRSFWRSFLESSPTIDIVIDDGGHEPHQQAVTLECLLGQVRPGGVYICEDLFGAFQPFDSFTDGLSRRLSNVGPGRRARTTTLHQHIASVHRYPMLTVIEKPSSCPRSFTDPPHGTEWPAGVAAVIEEAATHDRSVSEPPRATEWAAGSAVRSA